MGPIVSLRKWAALLSLAITAHNFEEWLTWRQFNGPASSIGKALGLASQVPPSWAQVQLALVLVTVVPVALLAWAAVGNAARSGAWVVAWLASTFLWNVFIPHVPQALIAGDYCPGLITAVAINLPLGLLALRSLRRGHLLTRTSIVVALLAGLATLPVAISLAYRIAATTFPTA